MIRNKPNLIRPIKMPTLEGNICAYTHRTCMLNRLDGYNYCIKHILEDKAAPYKQCSYVSSRKAKRCANAAPKGDRKDCYCQEHTRRATFLRHKSLAKKKPKESSETLLEELASCNNTSSDPAVTSKKSRLPSDSIISKVFDYASSSDSEVEPPIVERTWKGDGDSDAESIDSEQEDVLKHADVYTPEEVALILRDKSIRLQSLYIDQFKRLQHLMKETRRKFLHTHKIDTSVKSNKGRINNHRNQKLRVLKKYHKRHGMEALLHRQSKQRRISVSEGVNYRPPSFPKCGFLGDENVKCNIRTIPLSKFCSKHILHDPRQVFFQQCGFAEGNCQRPVPASVHPPFCSFHTPLADAELRIHNLGKMCFDSMKSEECSEIVMEQDVEHTEDEDVVIDHTPEIDPGTETNCNIRDEGVAPLPESAGHSEPDDFSDKGDMTIVT